MLEIMFCPPRRCHKRWRRCDGRSGIHSIGLFRPWKPLCFFCNFI